MFPLSPILSPHLVLTVPVMPPASLRPSSDGRGFCLLFTPLPKSKIYGGIPMSRPDLSTLTPRRARRLIAEHTAIFMEEMHPIPSGPYRYIITAECGLCDHGCSVSFFSRKVLLSAYVAASAGAFYSLCGGLAKVLAASDSAAPDGQNQAISDASEE